MIRATCWPDGSVQLGLVLPAGDRAFSLEPQGLSDAVNFSVNSTKRNRLRAGLTAYARRSLRSAAVLLEKQFGRSCLTFGTLTLPRLPGLFLFERVTSLWPRIVDAFLKNFRRVLRESGLSEQVLLVSELQTRRWNKTGEHAWHLHFLSPGRVPKGAWRFSPSRLALLWGRVVSNALGIDFDPAHWAASVRLEVPRKAVVRYLSKYLSKGVSPSGEEDSEGIPKLPSYWSLSRELRRLVRESLLKFSFSLPPGLSFYRFSELCPPGTFLWPVFLPKRDDSPPLCVGWVGFTRDLDSFLSFLLLFVAYEP